MTFEIDLLTIGIVLFKSKPRLCSSAACLLWTFIFVGPIHLMGGTVGRVDLDALRTPLYSVDEDAFTRHNGDRFSNRPLYCNHILAVVLGGDKPYLMLGSGNAANGSHMIALLRDGKNKWFFDASDITSKYRPDRMEWIVKDASWGDTTFDLEAVPAANGAGMGIRLRATGVQKGDQLIWVSGGATHLRQSFLYNYDMTTIGREGQLKRGFVSEDCRGNQVGIDGNKWTLSPPTGKGSVTTRGECSVPGKLVVADASAWADAAAMASHPAENLPCACGTIALDEHHNIYWSLQTSKGDDAPASPDDQFNAGLKRAEEIEQQVVVDTPDPWLNAGVGASCAVMDGVFRDGMYTHSGMRWATPLLGWRTTFGATAYGWHDNVKAEAKRCIAKQITESDKTTPEANPAALLSSQSPNSMLFGKGRVNLYQPAHYDMQSQFFDQLISAWHYTADPELEAVLRPSLDLDLEYVKNCFDPQGLGIYESYANTWPTDDQWYNGGGTSEETAYAYRGHQAALQMARRAGDLKQIEFHKEAIDKIRKAFFDLLWNSKTGHPGAYREQGGLKRLHDSCWLYSIFCPIDEGLLNAEQSAEALHYTETGLERIDLPYGGQQCWPSNWVPSIWSLREMWPGDNYQLALAYFQTGLADQGWSLLRGTFAQMMFFGPVPADLGHPAGGTDFNDCASMFCRTVVEGLFGYRPDYPAGKVIISPQFPEDWDHASIKTPDVSIKYLRHDLVSSCAVILAKAADLEIDFPVCTHSVKSVIADGVPVKYEVTPGFGQSVVKVIIPAVGSTTIEVTCSDKLPAYKAVSLEFHSGEQAVLKAVDDQIVDFHDPEGTLSSAKLHNGAVVGTITTNTGDHLLFGLVQTGQTQQWRMFNLHISDPIKTAAELASRVDSIPSTTTWSKIDLSQVMNADVRKIFQQKYLSPRPNTCSLRLATDGYSTWQMVLDPKNKLPEITFENVPSLVDGKGSVVTKRGVPFTAPAESNNIAFTSRWDNFPKQIDVPVKKAGEAIWLLLCGSTNPMECGIANAQVRLNYADGTSDVEELIPPNNFWSLCPFGGADYNYQRDGFCLPKVPPEILQLGKNCRAIVLNRRLRPGLVLKSVTLETLSEQVVIGLMGITIMNPN